MKLKNVIAGCVVAIVGLGYGLYANASTHTFVMNAGNSLGGIMVCESYFHESSPDKEVVIAVKRDEIITKLDNLDLPYDVYQDIQDQAKRKMIEMYSVSDNTRGALCKNLYEVIKD